MLIRGGWGGLVSICSPLLRGILAPTMAGEQSWDPAPVDDLWVDDSPVVQDGRGSRCRRRPPLAVVVPRRDWEGRRHGDRSRRNLAGWLAARLRT